MIFDHAHAASSSRSVEVIGSSASVDFILRSKGRPRTPRPLGVLFDVGRIALAAATGIVAKHVSTVSLLGAPRLAFATSRRFVKAGS